MEARTYGRLCELDVILPLVQGVQQGTFTWDDEKKVFRMKTRLAIEGPWVFGEARGERNCQLWGEVYFKYYGVIPKACLGCWKIVGKPRTLRDLWKIMELQQDYILPSKCGMEQRKYSPGGIYSAFWYVPLGVEEEEAVKWLRKVEKDVGEVVEEETPIFLKRACTEMEVKYGPTDGWVFGEEMERLEGFLDTLFDQEMYKVEQFPAMKLHVLRRWIEWAWEHGDPTVWDFARRDDFPAPPVKYGGKE